MEEIILFGTGAVARRFIYENQGKIDIKFFLDNNPKRGNYIYGYPVYKPDEIAISKLKKYKIVICSTFSREISYQLKNMGLREIDEFIPCSIYNKKVVILIGNCHMGVLKEMLRSNCRFNEEFGIYDLPAICDIKENNLYEEYERYVQYANVIIQQDIRDNNKVDARFSYSQVDSRISSGCKHICIINTYGLGKIYYPYFVHGNLYNACHNKNEHGYFPFDDLILDNLIKSGYPLEEVINIIKENMVEMMPVDIESIFEKYIRREEICDVKIMKYIVNNYKNRMLFYDIAHPTNDVLWEKTRQIFSILNVDDGEIKKRDVGDLGTFATPIYPAIKKKLGLRFDNDYLGGSARIRISKDYMDLEEYIREYYFWCSKKIWDEA